MRTGGEEGETGTKRNELQIIKIKCKKIIIIIQWACNIHVAAALTYRCTLKGTRSPRDTDRVQRFKAR